ncbi:Cytochrome b5 [Balamuthia mandrillaris]
MKAAKLQPFVMRSSPCTSFWGAASRRSRACLSFRAGSPSALTSAAASSSSHFSSFAAVRYTAQPQRGFASATDPAAKNEKQEEASLRTFSREEVAKHNRPGDIWVIINRKVYNISLWANVHPGGLQVLIDHAGKDATVSWANAGHGYRARSLMKQFLIGQVLDEPRFTGVEHPFGFYDSDKAQLPHCFQGEQLLLEEIADVTDPSRNS